MNSLVTISGVCPTCGHGLKLCQAKTGAFFIGCTDFPRCDFRGPYDPILQQLRDQNARLQAEVTLLQMQQTPPRPEKQPLRTLGRVVQQRRQSKYIWEDVARRWGATLRRGVV